MTATIDVPGVGAMDRRVVIGVGVAFAGFLGWRYFRASSGDAAPAEVDPGYEDGGTIPAVDGATDWYGSGTSPTGDTTSSTPQALTTNAQWTQLATERLLAVDAASGPDIASALGNYLSGRPLSSAQQTIVNAAIAYAGYPPVGSHVIVPGGNTDITIAPSGLRVTGQSSSAITLSWSAVAGAQFYDVYRSGAASNAVRSGATSATIAGLQPNTSYAFQVAAVSSGGKAGPKSSSVSGRTKPVTLARPAVPTVSQVTSSSVQATTGRVSGATGYLWYVNGVAHGHSDNPTYKIVGLRKSTKYRLTVKADTATQSPGPESAARTFTTKSK